MTLIEVDGKTHEFSEGITVKHALESIGHRITRFPDQGGIFMPCQTGGCWSCAMEIDGQLRPACITPIKEKSRIRTEVGDLAPRRLVGGFMPHGVGGVGTPWWLKGQYIEVACFAAGCNFRCPQCQNWSFTYMNRGDPQTPEDSARLMTAARRIYKVDRMAISGGECTLNRRWLVQYLRALKRINPGARLHVDTNGSILTKDYLDELVDAGMTDIGIDLKALRPETFMQITGLEDEALATKYMKCAWQAVNYLVQNHEKVFVGIGIPYNRDLISMAEIEEMGQRISKIDQWVQVCALDYRPEFLRMDIPLPTFDEMQRVHDVLKSTGLESVLCQTRRGRIGPNGAIMR
jgi:pyruvate formate lyase activating enzyme